MFQWPGLGNYAFQAIQANVQRKLFGVSEGLAFSFPPPAIPGIGTSGGVTMILQDRSGNDDPTFLTKNVFAFLGAISKRPEIAAAIPSYLPAVPQLYADVDKDKASQQQVDLTKRFFVTLCFEVRKSGPSQQTISWFECLDACIPQL